MSILDRYRGWLFGLAAGDALGTTVEFRAPGSFAPVTDIVGGGPFGLRPGQWTDDTSMALCLAESLVELGRFDPADQMRRYVRWWREGHFSSTGRFFDIGNTVSAALRAFEQSGEPYSGRTDPHTAGNGSLMRLAPVPLFFGRFEDAVEHAGQSSRTTHQAPDAIDACRWYAALIWGALEGRTKDELLDDGFTPLPGYWRDHPLSPAIAAIVAGSYKRKAPPEIRGTGHVVASLEAALWAFHRSASFEEGCLLAVNLGDDADTTGAVYGQLAGAYFGYPGIPEAWTSRIAMADLIEGFAARLLHLSGRGSGTS